MAQWTLCIELLQLSPPCPRCQCHRLRNAQEKKEVTRHDYFFSWFLLSRHFFCFILINKEIMGKKILNTRFLLPESLTMMSGNLMYFSNCDLMSENSAVTVIQYWNVCWVQMGYLIIMMLFSSPALHTLCIVPIDHILYSQQLSRLATQPLYKQSTTHQSLAQLLWKSFSCENHFVIVL